MNIISKFSERFGDIIFESEKSIFQISKDIGIQSSMLYTWRSAVSIPNLENLIKLADYFQCSIEYLMGRIEEETGRQFNSVLPIFHERLKYYIKQSGKSAYYLCKTAKIHKGSFMRWANGECVPLPDNLVKLANYFNCTIDQLIGRE